MLLASTIELFIQNSWLFYSTVFIFSVVMGSFLNVVIYRLPIMLEREWKTDCTEFLELKDYQLEKGVFNLSKPASTCPKCKTPIRAWQNIPILSFIFLGAKCASCKTPISYRYPFIELLSGVLGLILATEFGVSLATLLGLTLTYCFIALSFIDIDHKILPDNIVFPLLWIGLIANQYTVFTTPLDSIWGAVSGYLSLWSVYQVFKLITGKEGMGYGDFKLLACIGAWVGASQLLAVILISSIAGSIIGIAILVIQSKDKNTQIPFGPYLAIAGWTCLLWGEQFMGLIQNTPRF